MSRRKPALILLVISSAVALGFAARGCTTVVADPGDLGVRPRAEDAPVSGGSSTPVPASVEFDVRRAELEQRPPSPESRFKLGLTVADTQGIPVEGADVKLVTDLCDVLPDSGGSGSSCRSSTDEQGRATLVVADPSQYSWILVSRASYASVMSYLAEFWTEEVLSARAATIAVVMQQNREWTVRVSDPWNVPIVGAQVAATAAWGREAQEHCGFEEVVRLLAPRSSTDGRGVATVSMARDREYLVEASAPGFASAEFVLSGTVGVDYREITLAPVYVGGFLVDGAENSGVAFGFAEDAGGESRWRSASWRAAADAIESALDEKLGLRGVHWLLRVAESDGAAPQPVDLSVYLPSGVRAVEVPLHPVNEFDAKDLVWIHGEGRAQEGGTLRLNLVAAPGEEGPGLGMQVPWSMRNCATLRSVPPTEVRSLEAALVWKDLEPGDWQLFTDPMWAGLLAKKLIVNVRPGEQQEVSVDLSGSEGTRLLLDVVDRFNRKISVYQAILATSKGNLVVRPYPLPRLEDGLYRLTIDAPGYPRFSSEIQVDGPIVKKTVNLGEPGSMVVRWNE